VDCSWFSCENGYWQFADYFMLFDMRRQSWVEPFRNALIPPK